MAHEMGHAYRTETGIHAPWKLGAKTPKDQQWYILKSIEYWTGANVPADKIQVGLASYGKTFNTTQPPGTKEPPVNTDYDSRLYQKQIPPEILEEPPAGWTNTWPSNTIWGREPCDIKHVRRVTEGLTVSAGQDVDHLDLKQASVSKMLSMFFLSHSTIRPLRLTS